VGGVGRPVIISYSRFDTGGDAGAAVVAGLGADEHAGSNDATNTISAAALIGPKRGYRGVSMASSCVPVAALVDRPPRL
jgi:hypothetical protein